MKRTFKTIATTTLAICAGFFAFSFNVTTDQNQLQVEAISNRTIITSNKTDTQVNSYYTGVSGLTGDTLKNELNSIISGHTSYSYDDSHEIMRITDRDWTLSPLSNPVNYAFNDDPYMNLIYGGYNGSTSTAYKWSTRNSIWNKEHTWAKSHGNFGETQPAGTDLHHLRASDIGLNSAHGSYDFATIKRPGSPKSDEAGNPNMAWTGTPVDLSSGTAFEPHDMYKGDVARMIFYMATRYITYSSTGNPKLRILDSLTSITTSSSTTYGDMGMLSHLLDWNELDPVDDFEIKRNNLIDQNFQYNRNPYIDHPEWARIVYDSSYSGPGATIASGTSSVGSNPAWQNNASPLASISVNSSGAKTSYSLNQTLDTSGLIVIAHYEDGSSQVVSEFTTDPAHGSVLSISGNRTITVSYTTGDITKTSSYSVSVSSSERTLTSISLDTTSVKSTFKFAETFNYNNLIVTGYFSDSTQETINDYDVSVPDMERIGMQTIDVTYLDRSANYQITITNQGASIGGSFAPDLFISEYIEGSGYNKAIEIYNGTGATVDLSGYSLGQYNGSIATLGSYYMALSGTIAHDDVFVISKSTANATILSKADISTTSQTMDFNGNDAVVLFTGTSTSPTIIDIVGTIGDSADFAKDVTLTRKSTVSNPSDEYNASEWNSFATDTTTYLGAHTCDLSGGGDYSGQAIAYAEFFLRETATYCTLLQGGDVDWDYLSDEYGYMASEAKDYFTDSGTTDEAILASLERYEYLIGKYGNLSSDNFVVDGSGAPVYALNPLQNDIIDQNNRFIPTYLYLSLLVFFTSATSYVFIKKTRQSE